MFRLVTFLILVFATNVAIGGEIRPVTAPLSSTWEMSEDTLIMQIRNLSPEPVIRIYVTDHYDIAPSVVSLTIDSRPLKGDWIQFGPSLIYPGKIVTNMTVGPFDSLIVIKLLAPNANRENMNWFVADPITAFGYFPGCCSTIGDIDHVGQLGNVDISDLTYLVDYLFRLGNAPECSAEADLTGDGQVNVADLTSLVDFFFRGSGELRSCSL